MIKSKIKYCGNCKKDTTHTFDGKECKNFLLQWFDIAWKCDKCGHIHIQDTAYLENTNN